MVKSMSKLVALSIGVTAFVVSTVLVFGAGAYLFSFSVGLYAAAGWIGAYFAWNLDIIRQQDWQCVERLGYFHKVRRRGLQLYCMRGLIDVVKKSGNLLERRQPIFKEKKEGGKAEEIDFTDGSAPIEGYMWYKNGPENGTGAGIEEALLKYVYANEDPETRVVQIAEDRLRPKFQELDIDTASKTRGDVVDGVKNQVEQELEQYGLHFSRKPAIVIADIGLSDTQKALREEKLRGSKAADELTAEAEGYRRSIAAIMYPPGPDGKPSTTPVCDFETARGIWERQQTRKMLGKTGSNITLMGDSADRIIRTFEMNQRNGGRS